MSIMRDTFPTHPIFLYMITLLFGEAGLGMKQKKNQIDTTYQWFITYPSC
jgi:hypothetical protein